MSRTDLCRTSATRVEIDHRAREARLRLEQLERLLMLRVLPARPLLDRLLYWRAPRFFGGARMQSRSTKVAPTSARRCQSSDFPSEVCIGGVLCRPSTA